VSQEKPPHNDSDQPNQELRGPGSSSNAECDRILALIPAYSIGATDPDEDEFIKARLADCPQATAELAKHMKLAEILHYASPMQPPPTLANSLQAAIGVTPSSQARDFPLRQGVSKPVGGGFRQAPAGRYWRLGLILGAAILILLLGSNIYLLTQFAQVRLSQEQVAAHLHDHDTALMLVGFGVSNRLELPAVQSGAAETPFAALVWDPQGEYVLLYVKNFPPLQPDKSYQLWLERGGQQTSPGIFSVDEEGIGLLVFRTSVPIHSFDSVMITAEPAAGSAKPTTAPIVLWKS
jgi:hypothetical protein